METVEEESFQLKWLKGLVEKLVTSGRPTLDETRMKSLKKICKASDKYVVELFKILIKQLRKKHAEIRLSAFQICNEIFMRSHCFRQLITNNLDTVYNLTILINKKGPLLKPFQAAKKLQSTAITSLHEWYDKFGGGYIYLKNGYKYLKEVENVDFVNISILTEQDRRRREDRLRKEEEIKNIKIQNVINEMMNTGDDISNTILEFNNTFKLLIPDLNDFFVNTNEDFSENCDTEDNIDEDTTAHGSFEYGSEFMREHGLIKETLIHINLSKIHEVEETPDNAIIIATLKEQISSIKSITLPNVKNWEQIVMKYSSTHQELILKIIDIKRSLESILARYDSMKIISLLKEKTVEEKGPKKNASTTVNDNETSIQSSDDEDDFIDVPFDDPRVIQAAELEAAFLETQISSQKEKLKNSKISSEDLVAAGSSGVGHSKKPNGLKAKIPDLSIDSFMDDNLHGPLKISHSMPGLTNIWSGNEILHDHGEEVLKPSDMLGIATRAINFQPEWEPVLWECRAPLPSGRLCPRKDRESCPLHGPVIPRDNLGVPVRAEDAQREQEKQEEYERAHPEWQNPTLLAEIRAATGVDLNIKKAKKRKKKYPNLTNLRELENTPYNRLKKKIFSKKSVRRLNKALAKLPQ